MAEIGFPVVLDLVDRPCLVVGAGRVASFKIGGLLTARASVTVVAPEAIDTVRSLAERGAITYLARAYEPGEAAEYHFITSATGIPAVDGAVSADAERAGRLINAADDPAHCNVLLPSVARRGPITVAVSTTGTSPALAAWLRRRLEASLPDRIDEAAVLLNRTRAELRVRGISTEDVDFGAIIGPVVDLVAAGALDEAETLAQSLLPDDPPTAP